MQREQHTPTIDILVPVYNEEAAIPVFLEQLSKSLTDLEATYRVIFIDDGSGDTTSAVLKQQIDNGAPIKILTLSRNFGKEAALTAGLDFADADLVIPMDVDLQDPPELIPQFIGKWREGFDIVYGLRSSRSEDGFFKRLSAGWFYRLFNKMSDVTIPENAGDFRLLDRRVVAEIKKLKERDRFMKGLMAWPGFKSTGITFDRPARSQGASRWSYWRLFQFALSGIFSFSTVPLRIWLYVGSLLALISLLYGVYIIGRVLLFGVDVPGYASIMVAVIFIGGIQLITLGVLGEYLGRIFDEVKGRPIYIIERIDG